MGPRLEATEEAARACTRTVLALIRYLGETSDRHNARPSTRTLPRLRITISPRQPPPHTSLSTTNNHTCRRPNNFNSLDPTIGTRSSTLPVRTVSTRAGRLLLGVTSDPRIVDSPAPTLSRRLLGARTEVVDTVRAYQQAQMVSGTTHRRLGSLDRRRLTWSTSLTFPVPSGRCCVQRIAKIVRGSQASVDSSTTTLRFMAFTEPRHLNSALTCCRHHHHLCHSVRINYVSRHAMSSPSIDCYKDLGYTSRLGQI
jgi:hypothetical protein